MSNLLFVYFRKKLGCGNEETMWSLAKQSEAIGWVKFCVKNYSLPSGIIKTDTNEAGVITNEIKWSCSKISKDKHGVKRLLRSSQWQGKIASLVSVSFRSVRYTSVRCVHLVAFSCTWSLCSRTHSLHSFAMTRKTEWPEN